MDNLNSNAHHKIKKRIKKLKAKITIKSKLTMNLKSKSTIRGKTTKAH